MVITEQREKIHNGQMGVSDLETRVGRDSSVSRSGARLHSGGIHVGGVQGGSHSVTAGGQFQ